MYGAVDSTESTGEGQRDDIQSSIRSTASLTKNKRHQNAARCVAGRAREIQA